ncbi:MAG TPA: hypothetical protein PKW33_17595 [Anaerolineaceae bacterium]|nr:hypothetical protein [Anaerolineaceae bacterium]HPN53413.1 hypothetical protein [Anaerolineaceae bacterium]
MKQKSVRFFLLLATCILLAVGCLRSQPTQAATIWKITPSQAAIEKKPAASMTPAPINTLTSPPTVTAATAEQKIFIPTLLKAGPPVIFSVESNEHFAVGQVLFNRMGEISAQKVRLNSRVSWRLLQPNGPDDPIDWNKLADFEKELRALSQLNIRPIIVLNDSPRWATVKPTSCAAIRTDRFNAYAAFITQLIQRYSAPEFNVHDWELGNEVDVDSDLGLETDSVYGCWGDISKADYGGSQYGEMLKVVGPAIRQADPSAVIWMSGLLLASPDTSASDTQGTKGCPECFFDGVLSTGAAPYIDIVAYHYYPPYLNEVRDYDVLYPWHNLGGGVRGKAQFLRNVMAKYGVNKPLALNEIALMCAEVVGGQPVSYCTPPNSQFFEVQADFLVKVFTRAWSVDIMNVSWYTLNGPAWRYTGLVESSTNLVTPAYAAYVEYLDRLRDGEFQAAHNYGQDIEAYTFKKDGYLVDVVWANVNEPKKIQIPQSQWITAYDRNGNVITPATVGAYYEVPVSVSPIYIEWHQ